MFNPPSLLERARLLSLSSRFPYFFFEPSLLQVGFSSPLSDSLAGAVRRNFEDLLDIEARGKSSPLPPSSPIAARTIHIRAPPFPLPSFSFFFWSPRKSLFPLDSDLHFSLYSPMKSACFLPFFFAHAAIHADPFPSRNSGAPPFFLKLASFSFRAWPLTYSGLLLLSARHPAVTAGPIVGWAPPPRLDRLSSLFHLFFFFFGTCRRIEAFLSLTFRKS